MQIIKVFNSYQPKMRNEEKLEMKKKKKKKKKKNKKIKK